MPLEVGANREWFGAQSSLKFFTVKFLGLKWLPHYDDWYRIVLDEKRSCVQSPRGHGKSTFWSFALPLWDVIRGGADLLLISYSEDQVINLIRLMKQEVETNEYLAPLRPSTKEIWGADKLGFADGGIIRGLGFGTSARGLHPKRIIGDDVLKDLGGMSAEDQERAWFSVITGMAMPQTQIHVIGTPIDFNDLLMKLESNPVYYNWRKPALSDEGSPLCPQLFTKESLEMRRKEMGSINFAREYMLERIDPATQPFKSEYQTLYDAPPTNFARVVTVCDPAYTEGDGDATAIVTVGFTHGNHAYVLEAKEIRREDPGAVVNELFKTIAAYQPGVVGIEKKKGDAISFSFQERRTRENRWDFAYVELSHGGLSKGARANQVGGLIPRWEQRAVHVHRNQQSLLQQLYRFRFDDMTKGHDDLVDALAYCFHPDMAQPNTGKQYTPTASNARVGKAYYVVGSRIYSPPERKVSIAETLAAALDRRVA